MKLPLPRVLVPAWLALTLGCFFFVSKLLGFLLLVVGGLVIAKHMEKSLTPKDADSERKAKGAGQE